jgi:hypothetical protein
MSDERSQEVPKQDKPDTANTAEGNQILDSQTLENLAAFLSRDQEETKQENNDPINPNDTSRFNKNIKALIYKTR